MSEFLTAPSMVGIILGIIGTATGVFAIWFSYLTYKFQKPNLAVIVKSCCHSYPKSELFTDKMEIRFFPIIEIKNMGDRGTTMNKIELTFEDNGKKYVSEISTYGKQFERVDGWGKPITQVEYRWINASETIGLNEVFVEWSNEFVPKETIDCTLTVFTSRKDYPVKIASKKVKSSSSKEKIPIEK